MKCETKLPTTDFIPLFYVLDKGRGRVLAAKKQDRYEIKGMYFEFDAKRNEWEVYHASLNVQSFNEYPDRFDLTKDEHTALAFADSASLGVKLSEEQCNNKYSTGYYVS